MLYAKSQEHPSAIATLSIGILLSALRNMSFCKNEHFFMNILSDRLLLFW
jgi:hypothetical protein